MSIAWAMLFFGAILIYAGWTDRSVFALARGDNTTAKPTAGSLASSPTLTPTVATTG